MVPRALCEEVFEAAVEACDPERLLHDTLAQLRMARMIAGRARIGVAMGKAAFAMARGAGPVTRGVAVCNADDGRELPSGWIKMLASHPEPDARSLEAGDAVIDAVASATRRDEIFALVSGGASALVERPAAGVTLEQLRDRVRAVMASGAPIDKINQVRGELSAIKGGKLAAMSEAPITTFLVSDVVGDDPRVIGSGPTIGSVRAPSGEILLAPMQMFHDRVVAEFERRGILVYKRYVGDKPLTGPVDAVAAAIVAEAARQPQSVFVHWGEPTITVPADHGEGGRAQQLALELAQRFCGNQRSAFVAGSDGIDGPPPHERPAPAGAYIDGHTWDAIAKAGVEPGRALIRRDAGTALAAVGALIVTGPTGINHADVVIVG